MATSEVRRAKIRFILLTMGAGLLVFVLLFQQLLLDGVLSGLTGAIRSQSGEVIVFGPSAARNLAFSRPLGKDLENTISKHPAVAAIGKLRSTNVSARPATGGPTMDASLMVFQPGKPGAPTKVAGGRPPAVAGEIVVDREASGGRFAIGDRVEFTPTGYETKVVGFTEDSQFNVGPTFWMTEDGATELGAAIVRFAEASGINQLPAQELLVASPKQGTSPEALVEQLDQVAPDLDIVTREVAAATAPGVKEIKLAFAMILGLGYLVVGIVIGFFFLTLTMQKASSLTLLRAVGAPNRYLIRSLLQQVLLVTVGGVGVGVVMLLLAYWAVRSSAPVSLRMSTMALSGGLALGVALLGAVPPMRRILRTDPHDVVGRATLGGLT